MTSQAASRGREVVGLSAVLVAATALRLLWLSGRGLWIDEAYSVHLARLGVGELLSKLRLECTPPLYYLLLHGWMKLFGESELAIRSLSLLCGVAATWGAWRLAQRFLPEGVALPSALLLAFAPLHVYYSQEARMYALLGLLAVTLAGCALGWLATSRDTALAEASAASLALLYTHNVALFFVAGVWLSLLAAAIRRAQVRPVMFAGAVTSLLYLPWMVELVRQVGRQAWVLDWFVPFWEKKGALGHVLDSLWGFAFGPFPVYIGLMPPPFGPWPATLALVALAVAGAVQLRRSPAARVIGGACALAVALAVGYSILVQPVYIPGRTDHFLLPFFVLAVAAGLVASPWRSATWSIAGVYALLAVTLLVPYYRDPLRRYSLAFLEGVEHRTGAGDVVVSTGLTFAELEWFLRTRGSRTELLSFPVSAAGHPGYLSGAEILAEPAALERDMGAIVGVAQARLAAGRCLVVVWMQHPTSELLGQALDARFQRTFDSGYAFAQSITGNPVRLVEWRARAQP